MGFKFGKVDGWKHGFKYGWRADDEHVARRPEQLADGPSGWKMAWKA